MAVILTQPFLSTITAQTPRNEMLIEVNILGGDAIDRIYWELSDANENIIADGSTVISDDAVSESIRSYYINITGFTLVANNMYSLSVHTQRTEGSVSTNSVWSKAQVFNCYVKPTISLYYSDGYGARVPITNGTSFTYQPLNIGVAFQKNDAQSPAVLSWCNITLRDSNNNIVFQARSYRESTTEVYGLAEGQNYKLDASAVTADGMSLSTGTISGITFTAPAVTGSFRVEANNNCQNGTIDLTCYLDTLSSSVEKIEIQRQEQGALLWNTICTIENNNFAYGQFPFIDRLAGSNRVYLYRLAIITYAGAATYSESAEVLSQFSNAYICNGVQSFKLTNEWTESESKRTYKSGVYEPYGSKYPIVVNNAVINYDAGTTSATVLAATTEQNLNRIDRYAEVNLAKQFANFLTDGKPKVLKDFNGNLRIVAIQSSVSRNYVKELGNGICSTSFSWVEISDFSQTDLDNIGLFDMAQPDIPTYKITLDVPSVVTMSNTATSVYAGSGYTNNFTSTVPFETPKAYMYVEGQGTLVFTGSAVYTDGTYYYSSISLTINGRTSIVVELS